MFNSIKFLIISYLLLPIFFLTSLNAEQDEVYLQAISDQIQVITKDLKTLEKAVYQKSDIASSATLSTINSDGLNEDVLTKHLLKLNVLYFLYQFFHTHSLRLYIFLQRLVFWLFH